MIAQVHYNGDSVHADIKLPASKSISNRVLIIHALGRLSSPIHNLSGAADTLQLQEALKSNSAVIDAGEGGTTTRFLLAYFAVTGREVTLTASNAMSKRPVRELVDALRELGASIEYTGEEFKLPVKIQPSTITGKTIRIDGSVSSQFISALMLTGPYIPGGIEIEITGEILSLPYIQMTQAVMRYFGVAVEFTGNTICIPEGKFAEKEIHIEPDWSAASYWYEIAALNSSSKITLAGLKERSLQGDAQIARMMRLFGVNTTYTNEGVIITKESNTILPGYFTDDFSGCPDLGPALAGVCSGLNITADLFGLKNFRLKESDRAAALQRELYNLNVKTDFCGGSKFKIFQGQGAQKYYRPLLTYHDHRIAMALAPLAIKTGSVTIEDPGVVKKSYPGFWNDLESAGFRVTYRDLGDINIAN